MPPSFPYGGMENPQITYVTPTLLAGDRSLANVVAHEVGSHSVHSANVQPTRKHTRGVARASCQNRLGHSSGERKLRRPNCANALQPRRVLRRHKANAPNSHSVLTLFCSCFFRLAPLPPCADRSLLVWKLRHLGDVGELLDERGVSRPRLRVVVAPCTSLTQRHFPARRAAADAYARARIMLMFGSALLFSVCEASPCSLSARSSRPCTESCTRVRLRDALLLSMMTPAGACSSKRAVRISFVCVWRSRVPPALLSFSPSSQTCTPRSVCRTCRSPSTCSAPTTRTPACARASRECQCGEETKAGQHIKCALG